MDERIVMSENEQGETEARILAQRFIKWKLTCVLFSCVGKCVIMCSCV